MMESVSPAHERAGRVSNSSPACWLRLLAAGNMAFFLCEGIKGKQRGILSRFSTPSGINRAIPPQLVSPERLIGSSLFRVLLIGCYKDGGLYLIGSGTTMGWVKGWDLPSATKSKSISRSPSVILLCVSLNVPVWLSEKNKLKKNPITIGTLHVIVLHLMQQESFRYISISWKIGEVKVLPLFSMLYFFYGCQNVCIKWNDCMNERIGGAHAFGRKN